MITSSYGDVLTDFLNLLKNPAAVKNAASTAMSVVNDPGSLVEEVTLDTAWFPQIVVGKPLAAGGKPGPADALARLLKPKVTIRLKGLGTVVQAPYGEPGPTQWSFLQWGLILGGGALGYLTLRGVLAHFK